MLKPAPLARWLLLALILCAAIVTPFLLFEETITHAATNAIESARGRPLLSGALVVGLLAGDVVMPVPSSLVSAAAGAAFGWLTGAALIWVGMTLGALAGYALGASAGRVLATRIVGEAQIARANRIAGELGPLALMAARGAPILAEASVLAAGAARMRLVDFFIATSIGNAAVASAYALLGAAAASSGAFFLAFFAIIATPAAAFIAWRVFGAPAQHK